MGPENVMLDNDGHAIIMDFGISRSTAGSISSADGATGARGQPADAGRAATYMTMSGTVVGTLEYMSPEQACGEPADRRADIYALGLIFRDIVLGDIRLAGTTAIDELHGRMEQAPPPTRSVDPQIPPLVDDLIGRCIEPDAAQRFQTTEELMAALNALDAQGLLKPEPRRFGRKHAVAAISLVLALLAGTWWLARSVAPPPPPAQMSVLIEDFDIQGVEGLQGTVEQSLAITMDRRTLHRRAQIHAEEAKQFGLSSDVHRAVRLGTGDHYGAQSR
jgi:eukaryotic-like serine/threonine-protein kinase